MASTNSSGIARLSSDNDPALHTTLTVTSAIALTGCVVAVATKLTFRYVIPIAWKCCLLCQDIACLALSMGLLLISVHVGGASEGTCKAGGVFVVFGVLDLVCCLALMGLTFIVIQNPSKMSQLSTFRWGVYLSLLVPQKVVTFVLAVLPVLPLDYFDESTPYPLACFPVRQEGNKGATFGAILFFIMWGVLALGLILGVVVAVRFWAGPGTRVHASSPSLWQMQKMEQGRSLHKFTLLELALTVVIMFILTIIVYTNSSYFSAPQWIALLALVVAVMVHVVLALVQLFMWSGLCCDKTGQKKEPHHRLKRLELIKTDGPGKLRLKASWAAGKGIWKRGLLKVYGPAHIKAWAQEIVVLGLLRKSHSASVLQCLWTSNTNPYYETMTLISGDIVTSDSRLTCLELTSSGTLQDLLKNMDVPLPEPCQRTIMHDIAEGLSHLHDQNVLHRNLTSAAVYLKGSVQCLVLRAAIGDFEDAQIYGTLLTGSPSSTISRKRFFYPDIRAYALVGIEMLGRVCECRQREKQPHRRTAVTVSAGLRNAKEHSNKRFHHHRQLQGSNKNTDTEGNSYADDKRLRAVKRFESQEIPYCAPGEVEYVVSQRKAKPGDKTKHSDSKQKSTPEKGNDISENECERDNNTHNERDYENNVSIAEHNVDHNWILQKRINGELQASDLREIERQIRDSNPNYEEYKVYDDRFHHSQVPGITHVKNALNFEFPDNTVFRVATGDNEELEMIEEEIERGNQMKGAKNGQIKQGGYVTSRTEDGREIFIPAVYKKKASGGNSSSGYGSSGGGTPAQSDHYSSIGFIDNAKYSKQVHKTTSAATISSFEDDALEVLPGMADVDEKPRRGEHMLKELLKAKQDARVEQLIVSYEERVRNGELGANLEGLPIGVVFPKKNRQLVHDVGPVEDPSQAMLVHVEEQVQSQSAEEINESQNKAKLESPRPKTAKSSITQRLQQTHRPYSASNSSFYEWNARSSIKRNKARVALQRALSAGKGHQRPQQRNVKEDRAARAKEIELKYAHRPKPGEKQKTEKDDNIKSEGDVHGSQTKYPTTDPNHNPPQGNPIESTSLTQVKKVNEPINELSEVKKTPTTPVQRKQSTKTHPAPQPPQVPSNASVPQSLGKFSSFSSYDTDPHSSPRPGDESFTSVEPASTETESTARNSVQSTEQSHVEKIESDMNNIINENNGAANSNSILPPGIRLIDSGFDSASVSSEESCLCAAAALQAAEDGSCSCPSEIFTQGSCSCACSNCLGSAQGYNNGSSWTGSQDSESWSNSNSFSSYDANMYRRKLPTKRDKHESPDCVLAPDEQYPSPVRRTKHHPNALHPHTVYSPKRNRRRLSHTKGHSTSSASETSSAASRRYRELIKKGVPLRVSVISGDTNTPRGTSQNGATENVQENSTLGENVDDSHEETSALFNDLDKNGFFGNDPESHYQTIGMTSKGQYRDEDDEEDRYQELSPIPSLEDIIKEIPDETGNFSEETKAFLNRPESELSVKALQAVLSRHGSATEGKSSQPQELIIDRIFTHHGPPDNTASNFGLQGTLDLDESAIREVAMLPSNVSDDQMPVDIVGLLSGMDVRHVRYCHGISSRMHLINVNELLPANPETFDKLRTKLHHTGTMGLIGTQILDLIRMCWLNDIPPTTTAIMDQLTDHVTETEL